MLAFDLENIDNLTMPLIEDFGFVVIADGKGDVSFFDIHDNRVALILWDIRSPFTLARDWHLARSFGSFPPIASCDKLSHF